MMRNLWTAGRRATLALIGAAVCWQAAPGVAQSGTVQAVAEAAADGVTDGVKVGWIELSETLRETPVPFAWLTEDDGGPSLQSVLEAIDTVRREPRYKGLVLFLDQPDLTLTQCTAIADALKTLRESGKTVLAFAEVYRVNEYLIASAADAVLLQHKGAVELSGIAVEEMYLAGMLEKIGVKPDLMQVGRYKGADETWMRRGPSEPWDENFDALLDGLYEQTLARITEGRGLSRAEVESLMEESWLLTDRQLLERRAVDQLVDRDLLEATESFFGEDFEWVREFGSASTPVDMGNPFALLGTLFKEPELRTRRPTLAVIHAEGPIGSGDSSRGEGLLGGSSIGSRTLVGALEDALLDENVKGAVLRIDSPGGSALASEVIWQAVREFGESKPIFAVVGGMAASGGYYIVSAADQIYVQPHSILGSIGVVGGKVTLGGLYDWAGVEIHRRTRGPGADLFNSVEPFTPPQREKVGKALRLVYDQFLDRVKTGRGERLADAGKVAEGRLFTGAATLGNGMADRAGGVDQAIADLAVECALGLDAYDVVHLPAPMSLGDYLSGMFGVRSAAATPLGSRDLSALHAARAVLGPVAWQQVSRSLRGLMLLQDEAVLTLMPAAVVVGR